MKHFYTDGLKTIKLDIENGDSIPEGFTPGRTFNAKPWNKGLTKEDPRVLNNTIKGHKTRREKNNYKSWNTGLTKETSTSLECVSKKVSVARKGKSSWNKGIPASEERKRKQSETMKNKDYSSPEYQKKIKLANARSYRTKLLNHSLNSSQLEETRYIELCQQYGIDDVVRQYKDSRYPWICDFYIKSKDLFIEVHGIWTHGGHPFDENDPQDLKKLAKWQEKAVNSLFYDRAIYNWTVRDVKKLKAMRDNHLNFIIEYSKSTITK